MLRADEVLLDVLESDPGSPASGEIWCSSPNGLGPKASQSAAGFMSLTDKTKLDNIAANGTGDDWISGLLIEAQASPDQTVKYSAGTYMINGVIYVVSSGGNYDLTNGYGGVNHYTALSAGQRALVLIYVDTAQVIKSVAGSPTSDTNPPQPAVPDDSVCLAFILISKHSNGNPKNITPADVTDVRYPRRGPTDEAVKVDNKDTTSGFLRSKLTDNGNIQFTIENADGNESLKADVKSLGITDSHVAVANKDGAAGTASMRTLGTGAQQACAGNDSRLSDNRTDSNAIHKAVASEISGMTEKATPVSGDLVVIEDSADSYNKKKVQVGNLPGGSGTDPNAIHKATAAEINGITEKTTPIGDDIAIIEDSADSYNKKKVKLSKIPVATGSLPSIQLRRTTTYSLTASYVDITFDTVDLANDTSTLERDGTYTERINVKKDGLYLVTAYGRYHQASSQTLYPQIKKNGTTVIAPSQETILSSCGTNDAIAICRPILVSLSAGDYITLQLKAGSTGNSMNAGILFEVIKLDTLTGVACGQRSITIDISYDTLRYFTTESASYVLAADLIFRGTSVTGTPSAMKIISWADNPATYQVRVYDVTNSLTICESGTLSNTTKSIISLGTISNLPTTEAIWEVQIKKLSGSAGKTTNISVFQIQF